MELSLYQPVIPGSIWFFPVLHVWIDSLNPERMDSALVLQLPALYSLLTIF